MKPTYLFGSGTSPAPNVTELTELVLNARMRRHGDGIFRIGDSDRCYREDSNDNPDLIRYYLGLMRADIASYQDRPLEKVTYEDVANVCVQLDKESGSLRNPALALYRDDLLQRVSGQFPAFPKRNFDSLCWSAVDWIQWAVYHVLYSCGKSPTALRSFLTAVLGESDQANIITLNHDVFLEKILGNRVSLGFRRDSSGVELFDPSALSIESGLRLLKLHGSIDWFWHADSDNHRRLPEFDAMEIDTPPSVLAGTISKLESYNFSIFPWLWAEFQNVLRNTRRIVVSGYGFKDVGVNARLSDWLTRYEDSRMVVIHPDPKALVDDTARERVDAVTRFFRHSLSTLSSPVDAIPNSKIIFLPVKFEDVSSEPWALWLNRYLHQGP